MSGSQGGVPPQVETLAAMPAANFDVVRLSAKNSLARALRPEYLGIDPTEYADITTDLVELASADRLRVDLIDVKHSKEGSLLYSDPEIRRPRAIAATPSEFKLLAGNLQTLGARAVKQTEAKRQNTHGIATADSAAAKRAGVHAVESRVSAMTKYLDTELSKEDALILKFREAAKHPGLARFSNEAAMRIGITTIRHEVFGKLFEALRGQRGWSAEQEDRARRSVERRLFIDRFNNQHIGRFDTMLALAQERNSYLQAITLSQLYSGRQYIARNRPDAS